MIRLINHSGCLAGLYPHFDSKYGLRHVCVVKATWQYDVQGQLTPDSTQPINLQDSFCGFPNVSSLLQATESTPPKNCTELLCYGRVHPPRTQLPEMHVSLALYVDDALTWEKSLTVTGQRYWYKQGFGFQQSDPAYIKAFPLRYEYAYGGRYQGNTFDANPAGIGYGAARVTHNLPLPQIEYTMDRLQGIHDSVLPGGFGPLPVAWARADIFKAMAKQITLPNRASMAPFDQCFKRAFQGGEVLEITGLHRQCAVLKLQIPSLKPHITLNTPLGEQHVEMLCDTVVLDTERQQLNLVWRQQLDAQSHYKSCLIQARH
jgi:hypothetical protein